MQYNNIWDLQYKILRISFKENIWCDKDILK